MSGSKIHRITFSKSLAEFICQTNKDYNYKRMTFVLGKELSPGEKSPNGLYAIVKAKTNWTLRITFFQELAEEWRSSSRKVYSCFFTKGE